MSLLGGKQLEGLLWINLYVLYVTYIYIYMYTHMYTYL